MHLAQVCASLAQNTDSSCTCLQRIKLQFFRFQEQMLRPHIQGAASGSAGALLFKLILDTLGAPPPVVPSFADPVELGCDLRQVVEQDTELPDWLLGLDLRSFVVGVAVGVICGPVIDFIYLLRVWWAQSIHRTQARLQRVGNSLYRLLA